MENIGKIGFFKRIKMSIFDLEKYDVFFNEKIRVALKYFFKLILILVAIFAISTTIQIVTQIDDLLGYVKNEFPDFEYRDGELTVNRIVEAYDKKYDSKLIVDTGDVSEEKLEEYKLRAEENGTYAILLKDNVVFRLSDGLEAKLLYTDFLKSSGINTLTKADVVNKYNENGFLFQLGIALYLYSIILLYVNYLFVVLENILVVTLFGWIASRVVGAKLKISKAFIIAIYGLTLSSILNVVYSIVASFTTFEIKYFSLMYLIIGYIYMMAVIFINKADIIEKNNKVSDIIEVEKIEENIIESETEDVKKDNKEIKNEDNKE